MKKQIKSISLIILLLIIFLVAVYFTSDRSSLNQPDYTVLSYADKGVSLLFDTYKDMGLPVEMYQKSIDHAELESIQIIIQPDTEFLTDEEFDKLTEFVNLGGNVVYLTNISPNSLFADKTFEVLDYDNEIGLTLYSHGKGQIIYAISDLFTNKSLLDDRRAGLELLNSIYGNGWTYEKIYFNEYYHGYGHKTNLWVALPVWAKQTVCLILLITALIVVYLGKRFGKAKPYYEELERDENEYVVAVGRLYHNALLYKKIADNYFNDFIYKCCICFKIDTNSDTRSKINIIRNNWKDYGFPEEDMLDNILDYEKKYVENPSEQISKSVYKSLISSIERLNTIIEKGSDYKWR